MYTIRKINSDEVEEALALVLEVFLEFEAPYYKPEGVEFFRNLIQSEEFISKRRQGLSPVYAAFDKGKIIGIMGMRPNRTHINLAFVRKEYHRQWPQQFFNISLGILRRTYLHPKRSR